jgi:hypothetical protein
MGTTDATTSTLDRFTSAPMVRLIDGPWGGKELPDMTPNESTITVWAGITEHTYDVADGRLTAVWRSR